MSIKVYFQGFLRLTLDRNIDSLKRTIEAIETARHRTVHILVCELLVQSWARTDFNTLIEFLRQIYSRTYEPVGTRIIITLPDLAGCESNAFAYPDFDVIYECSYSERFDLESLNGIRGERGYKLVEQVFLSNIQAIQTFSIVWPAPVTAPSFKKTALGGTFDYLHAAHMLLLTIQSLLTERELVVGITSDVLLKNKRHPCFIQSFNERSFLVRQFFILLHPGQVLHIFALKDRSGPTATDAEIEAIILSKEVEAAGPIMNAQRAENGLQPMSLYVLDDVGLENKFSSTELRTQLQVQVKNQGDWLKQKWMDLCRSLGVAEEPAWDWYSLIVRKYCRSYRGYHNLLHVLDKLQNLENCTLSNRAAVEVAAWFDDVIYDTYDTTNNEKQSAALCKKFLTSLNITTCDNAVTYILATHKHTSLTNEQDELEFLDLDMSILGADPERYGEFSRGIRKEYFFYSAEEFRSKRIAFLRDYLSRAHLFFLPHNRARWEAQARVNIAKEIESLSLASA